MGLSLFSASISSTACCHLDSVGGKKDLKESFSVETDLNTEHEMFVVACVGPQEEYYGRELIVADRELVEQQADQILEDARETDVAFLVVGDPFG